MLNGAPKLGSFAGKNSLKRSRTSWVRVVLSMTSARMKLSKVEACASPVKLRPNTETTKVFPSLTWNV